MCNHQALNLVEMHVICVPPLNTLSIRRAWMPNMSTSNCDILAAARNIRADSRRVATAAYSKRSSYIQCSL